MKFKTLHHLFMAALCVMIITTKSANAKEVKMSEKWHKLNGLIDQEERTIRKITKMGPRLKWRLIELNTERIKLIREKENKIFLSAADSERKNLGKAHYFKESSRMYHSVRKDGLAIIKKWPRFKFISDIYYTLALNARDYGGDTETEKFLLKALKTSHKYAKSLHAIKTSLAEYYYNKKMYPQAIGFYKQVLENKEDEWYTKHLYNASWCYIKNNQYNEAIENALLSYEASKVILEDTPKDQEPIKKYISVTDQVLESIGLFYVMAERVEEGTKFYVNNVDHPANYLIKMAKKTAQDKSADLAEYVFVSALNNALDKKSNDPLYLEEEVQIRIELLDFYREAKKFEKFWNMSVALDEINKEKSLKSINEEFQTQITEKLRSLVGYLQVRFTKNSKTNITEYNESDRDRIISYFDVLARINPIETDSYRFYQGETFFAIADYKSSFEYYQRSLEAHKDRYFDPKLPVKKDKKGKKGNVIARDYIALPSDKELLAKHTELTKKIFDALLASLENGQFEKSMNFERTVYTYNAHIAAYPKDERTRTIYTKLFNLYLGEEKVNEATSTLKAYMAAYSKDLEIQQGMFTQVMDLHIKQKNTDALALWIAELQKGFLSFKKDYIEKSILILGGLLFDQYQKMDIAGNREEAAKGYLGLYESEKYPQSIKAKSAYRASIIYLDMFLTKNSFKWLQTSLKLFTAKERFERKNEILAMVNKLMLAQDFESSAAIAEDYIDIYCYSPFKEKDDLYQASVQYRLIEGQYEQAYKNYERGSKCNVKKEIREAVLLGMGDFFFRHRKYKTFLSFFDRYQKVDHMKDFFHNSFMAMYWDYYVKGSEEGKKLVKKIFKKQFMTSQKSKAQKEMELVMEYDRVYKNLYKTNISSFPAPSKYEEATFNKALETNIKTLKEMAETLRPFIKSGQAHIITKSYKLLEDKYRELAIALREYTPQGLPKEYVDGLKQALNGFANNLDKESHTQRSTAVDLIQKETILAPNNAQFMDVPAVIERVQHRHPASLYAIPSDRIGGQI